MPLLALLSVLACTKETVNDSTPVEETGTAPVDADQDGFVSSEDCDDSNGAINPDAAEICDGVDNDCSGMIDDNATDAQTWFQDLDKDGFGDDATATLSCEMPEGFVAQGGDCDDKQPLFYPGAEETCTDDYDYNCDGSVGRTDADEDGFAACEECDDSNASINPGAEEYCDGVDNDCNGTLDDDYALDTLTWYEDMDGDGYGTSTWFQACEQPSGYADNDQDCLDSDPATNPGATEVDLDGVDQDCDGYDGGVDTDGDGLDDDDEVNIHGSDPTKTDTDGDGLDDGDEVNTHGTDPALADTDGDGWDDDEEVDSYTDANDSTDHPYTGGWEIDSCRSSTTGTGNSVGDIATNFSLTDQNGDTVKLHDFCGKAVLLDFSTMWCGVCQAKASTLGSWYSTYKDYGFIVVQAHSENSSRTTPTQAELLSWDTNYSLGYPVIADTSGTEDLLYDPKSSTRPTLVLIEPGMSIVSVGDSNSVVAADIEAILPTTYP